MCEGGWGLENFGCTCGANLGWRGEEREKKREKRAVVLQYLRVVACLLAGVTDETHKRPTAPGKLGGVIGQDREKPRGEKAGVSNRLFFGNRRLTEQMNVDSNSVS